MLRADSHEMTVMKRLSLSYRSCPGWLESVPGHPRLPSVQWDPVLTKGHEPLAFPSSEDRVSHPAGAPCPLPAVRGREPAEFEPKNQKLPSSAQLRRNTQFVFNQTH